MTKAAPLLNDCFLHDKDRLRHAEALEILRSRISPVVPTQTVALHEAMGRILAETVHAPQDVPLCDNSAVDGYAFRFSDHEPAGGFFQLRHRIAAGHPAAETLAPGGAARIFTGAVMPVGADTVAMQEDCETHEQDGKPFVIVPNGLKLGANCRKAGEDLTAGIQLMPSGHRLRAQDIAGLASIGMAQVNVFAKLKIGLFATGDELKRPGEPLSVGEVYDSNTFLLKALASSLPVEIEDLGILEDKQESVETALAGAAEQCDLVLTTGGASKGEEDHVGTALTRLGHRHMWQLAIKPGRPMMFGQIGNTVVLGLPGNPVAAMVCFLLYGRPVISRLSGGEFLEPQRFQVPADFAVAKKKPDRREYYRGTLVTDIQGMSRVKKFQKDGSGLITGLREADGLIEIAEETRSVEEGSLVTFLPFSGMGLIS
ncbi:gephyrin-like molybdotransferase Glp [Roseibium sp.]|uniref:molybdopterin molybdotransferase MoeA n=1 Tax=Roseibium sp. TaxID=1936156 RepID=UPI003A974180